MAKKQKTSGGTLDWAEVHKQPWFIIGGFVVAGFTVGMVTHAQLDQRDRQITQDVIDRLTVQKSDRDVYPLNRKSGTDTRTETAASTGHESHGIGKAHCFLQRSLPSHQS